MNTTITPETVLNMLRQLPPRDRLKVIALTLPAKCPQGKVERELPAEYPKGAGLRPLKSLRGLCADMGPAPSAEEIDQSRREAWANFPREDV